MKRHFLSMVCTMALMAFLGQSLYAQQEATPAPSSNDNVIIIQKTQNEDGTWTVKKKSIQKGQSADAYIKEMDIEGDVDDVSEIIINTNGKEGSEGTGAETIMMIRKGSNRTEIKWNGNDDEVDAMAPKLSTFALINDQEENGEPKAFLGIYPETAENGGVLVTDIVPGAAAAAAGLKAGDIITSMDGKVLSSQKDLSTTLASLKPGDAVSITLTRDGQSITTVAELTAKKQERHVYHYNYNYNYIYDYNYDYSEERSPCEVFIGVQIGSFRDGDKGVSVNGIIAGWPAEDAGMQAGDRIVSIDGVPVNTHNELVVERDKHKPGEFFTIGYERDGKVTTVKAQFKSCPGQEVENQLPEQLVEQPATPQISNTLELEALNAYPNPTYGDLNVTFKGEALPTTVTITDINGKTIFNESLPNFDGNYNRQVDVSNGAPGTLLVSIRQGGKILTTPVILLNRA